MPLDPASRPPAATVRASHSWHLPKGLIGAILPFVLAAPAVADNLLVNPGFESGTTSWVLTFNGTSTLNTNLANVHSGAQSIQTSAGSSGTSVRGVYQLASTGGWSVPSTKIFRYHAWVMVPTAGTTPVYFHFADNYNGAARTFAQVTLNTSSWTEVVSDWMEAPTVTTGQYAGFQFQGIGVAAPLGYMDDLQLETTDGILVSASAGTGGTISPAGTVAAVPSSNKTYTITPAFGYSILDVTVDSGSGPVSQGAVSSVTLTNIAAPTTVAATFLAAPTHTVSGTVTAAAGGGATVSFKTTATSLPVLSATTDSSGNYSIVVPDFAYSICASQTGYQCSPDQAVTVSANTTGINFTLTAGRNIPKMENLILAAVTDNLSTADGAAIGTWNTLYPAGKTLDVHSGTPTMMKVAGIKWENNHRTTSDSYQFGSSYWDSTGAHPIACNGATIVVSVRPDRSSGDNDNWKSIVDMFYDRLCLIIQNGSGIVGVKRNGGPVWGSVALPNLTAAIVSLVVQPDGSYAVYANGTSIMTGAAITGGFTQIVPGVTGSGVNGYGTYVNVGKNNPDGWPTYNGGIADVFVYNTALSAGDRATLEADINTKLTTVTTHDITSSAGAGGSISPLGVTAVGEGDNETYTITPAFGYDIADVAVDVGTGTESHQVVGTYTFSNVTTTHTIAATFAAKTTYAVSGKVTDGINPIAGATVYISSTANASLAPLYTAVTDGTGTYSVNVFSASWHACASATGYTTSPDISLTVAGAPVVNPDFALVTSGKNIPQMDKLWFALYGSALTANGATTNPWPLEQPKGVTAPIIGAPALATVDGLQWEQNRYATGDGYQIGSYTTAIPVTGITAMAAFQPVRNTTSTGRSELIDVMYSRFFISVENTTGELMIVRNGAFISSGYFVPDGQKTIVSVVVQPTGQFKVYANGTLVRDETTTSDMTSLNPNWNGGLGFWSYVNVGRNSPDGWTVFNGQIGAAFLWKTALSPSETSAFESQLGTLFGISVGVTDPFVAWIDANYPTLSDKTPAGDPDHDGMSNQQEFAFGLNPSSGSSVNPISVPLDKTSGKFSYTRRATPASTGLVYTVLTSTDLVTWTADATATAGQTVTATNGDVETVQVTLSATPVGGKLFVRVAAQ